MIHIKNGFKGERMIVFPKMVVDMMEHDPVCGAMMITHIGYYPNAKCHYIDRRLPIDEYVLIYCVSGAGWCRLGGRRYAVSAGQYFVLPPDVPHSYGASDGAPWSIYWLHIKGWYARVLLSGVGVPHVLADGLSCGPARIQMFEEMYCTLAEGYDMDNLRYAAAVLGHYLGTLLYPHQFVRANGGTDANVASGHDADVCQQAISYMKAHIDKQVTIKELAEYTGYIPTHFAAVFRKSVGHPPIAYFILLKIQAAAQYLQNTRLKVNQIAAKFGYEDFSYFSRVFSKVMGCSPSDYRRMPHC